MLGVGKCADPDILNEHRTRTQLHTQHTTHVHAKTRAHAQITIEMASGHSAPDGASAYGADAATLTAISAVKILLIKIIITDGGMIRYTTRHTQPNYVFISKIY